MTVPPPVAQGSPNGTTWTDVGTIVPTTIVPQGTNAVLQLGPSTFCYDNAAGPPAYTRLRVGFCAGTPQSAPVILGQAAGAPGCCQHRHRGVYRRPTGPARSRPRALFSLGLGLPVR